MSGLKAVVDHETEHPGVVVSIRAAFIEVGYNFLSQPSTSGGRDFVKVLKKDLVTQRISYKSGQLRSIVIQVLEKLNREYELGRDNIPDIVDTFEILK
jgi:hypothetical protein